MASARVCLRQFHGAVDDSLPNRMAPEEVRLQVWVGAACGGAAEWVGVLVAGAVMMRLTIQMGVFVLLLIASYAAWFLALAGWYPWGRMPPSHRIAAAVVALVLAAPWSFNLAHFVMEEGGADLSGAMMIRRWLARIGCGLAFMSSVVNDINPFDGGDSMATTGLVLVIGAVLMQVYISVVINEARLAAD